MSHTGLYFPKPYPGELLYSVIARFSLHLGFRSPKYVLDILFGTRNVVATPDLQGQLGRLQWLFEQRLGMSCEDAVMQLTLMPYYVANRTPKERRKLIARQVQETGSAVHTTLGICATTVHTPGHLRFCANCMQLDMEQYGEPYWHRAHQLSGVFVCPIHGSPLNVSNIPLRPHGRHEFVPLTQQITGKSKIQAINTRIKHNLLWEIAKRSSALLDADLEENTGSSNKKLKSELMKLGYDGQKGSIQRLEQDIVAYYGSALLSLLDCSFKKHQVLGWIRHFRRNKSRTLHPLRQILLEQFIECREPLNQGMHFGTGPWPCLNPLADHYKKPVVTKMEPFSDKRHPERRLGRFTCSCGYVYSHRADHYPANKPFCVVDFGPLYTKEAKRLYEEGNKVGRIAWLLDVDWKTANNFIEPTDKLATETNDTSVDKEDWLELIGKNPSIGVKSLRELEPALYARLYRNERDWLRENSPRKVKPNKRRQRRVNWLARDEYYQKKVVEIASIIRHETPLKRVTKSLIATRLGCRALFDKKIHLLPNTHKTLVAEVETEEDYRVRRLRSAFKRLGPTNSTSMLLRSANIRKAYLSDRVLRELGNLYGRNMYTELKG